MTDADGFASVGVEPMSVGKRVFLLAIVTIPTVMLCMTTASPTVQKGPAAVKKVWLTPVEKQLLVEGTARTRSGAFSYPRVGREVRPIYIISWSGAVEGIAVVVVLHSLMLQEIEVNTKNRD